MIKKINLTLFTLLACFYSSLTLAGVSVPVSIPEPSVTVLLGLGVAVAYFIAKGRKK